MSLKTQLASIGSMDELIGFATKTETVENSGAVRESFDTPTPTIRAQVRYDRTNEGEQGTKQEKFTTEIKIWIRYNSSATQYKYVYWRSNYYDIYAIETTPRSRFMVIKARLIEE